MVGCRGFCAVVRSLVRKAVCGRLCGARQWSGVARVVRARVSVCRCVCVMRAAVCLAAALLAAAAAERRLDADFEFDDAPPPVRARSTQLASFCHVYLH